MNWNQFLTYLSAVYVLYYTGTILFDYLRSRRQPTVREHDDELFFSDDAVPRLVVPEEYETDPLPEQHTSKPGIFSSIPGGLMESTGGVSIKELFDLAKIDAIEYTKAIPF